MYGSMLPAVRAVVTPSGQIQAGPAVNHFDPEWQPILAAFGPGIK